MQAFQENAFQGSYPSVLTAFQTFDRFVSFGVGLSIREFISLNTGPLMQEYARGSAIVFEAKIYDPSQRPALPFSPESVVLNLYAPDGSFRLSQEPLVVISVGFYKYIFQSGMNDSLGVYEASLEAVSGAHTTQTISQVAFRLVEG